MPAVLALLLILLVVLLFWVTSNVIGVLITLLIAGLVGALADAVVPGRVPFGWLGAIVAGLLGSWIGVQLIGQVGPVLAGVPVIPAFVGALIVVAIVELLLSRTYRRGREL